MTNIVAHKISKSYAVNGNQLTVIDDFSYEFTDGTMYCIWGKSGSGKSTLLKMLGLLTEPTTGAITYNAQPVSNSKARSDYLKNQIGWVLQNNNLIDNLSLIDNLKIASPSNHSQREIESALDNVGLLASIDKKGKHLSGGEAQRLAFARATLKNPRVLIIDEFTSGLDADLENRLIALTREYTSSGATTLIASHSPAVHAAADHILEVTPRA